MPDRLRARGSLIALLLLTNLIFFLLYCRFLTGDAVYLYMDIGSDSIASSLPIIAHLQGLFHAMDFSAFHLSAGFGFDTTQLFLKYLNPVKLPLLFFTKDTIPAGLMLTQWLQVNVLSLSSFGVFRGLTGRDGGAVAAALIWTFSGYVTLWSQNLTFGSCLATFSFCMYILERALSSRSLRAWLLLAMSFALSAVTNYYFTWMMLVFMLFWLVFRAAFRERSFRGLLHSLGFTLSSGLMAVALASFPLAQIVYGFLHSVRTDALSTRVPAFSLQSPFTLLSVLGRVISINAVGVGSSYSGAFNYYEIAAVSSSVLVLYAVLYLLFRKQTRCCALAGLLLSAAAVVFRSAGRLLVFNSGTQRYTFMISFAGAAALAFFIKEITEAPDRRALTASSLLVVPAILGAALLIRDKGARFGIEVYTRAFKEALLFAAIAALILLFTAWKGAHRLLLPALLALTVLELVVMNYDTLYLRAYVPKSGYASIACGYGVEEAAQLSGALPADIQAEQTPGALPADVQAEQTPGALPADIQAEQTPGALPVDIQAEQMPAAEAPEVPAADDPAVITRSNGAAAVPSPGSTGPCRISATSVSEQANTGMLLGFPASSVYYNSNPEALEELFRAFGIGRRSANHFLVSWYDSAALALLGGHAALIPDDGLLCHTPPAALFSRAEGSGGSVAAWQLKHRLPFGYLYTEEIEPDRFRALRAPDRLMALTHSFVRSEAAPSPEAGSTPREDTSRTSAGSAQANPSAAMAAAAGAPGEHTSPEMAADTGAPGEYTSAAPAIPCRETDLIPLVTAPHDLAVEAGQGGILLRRSGEDPYFRLDIGRPEEKDSVRVLYLCAGNLPASLDLTFYLYPVREGSAPYPSDVISFCVNRDCPEACITLPDDAVSIRLDPPKKTWTTELTSLSLLEYTDPGRALEGLASTEITGIRFDNDCYEADLRSDGGMLCIPVLWSSCWTAEIDGQPAGAQCINGGLTGLELPAGSVHVELRWQRPYAKASLTVSLAVLLLWAILLIRTFRQGRRT